MELENPSAPFEPVADRRPRIDPPPPVRLQAVNDCSLPSIAGQEPELDRFYVRLLGFERDDETAQIVYRAENFRLQFQVRERPPLREDFIALGVSVPSLSDLMTRLNELELPYTLQRGLVPGTDSILLLDPAGNILEIAEIRTAI
jgi:hypothetical protein